MRTLNALIHRCLRVLLTGLIAILIVPVTLQIFSRFIDFIPRYIWTEEDARFCLIWIIMLGATIAVRDGTHFDVDVLPPAKTAKGLAVGRIIVHAAMFAVALIFVAFGWRFALFGYDQNSETDRHQHDLHPHRVAVRRPLLDPVPDRKDLRRHQTA